MTSAAPGEHLDAAQLAKAWQEMLAAKDAEEALQLTGAAGRAESAGPKMAQ
jgi:hypothetical protein